MSLSGACALHASILESIIENQFFIYKVGLTSQPPYCFICEVKNSENVGFKPKDLIIFWKLWMTIYQKSAEKTHNQWN